MNTTKNLFFVLGEWWENRQTRIRSGEPASSNNKTRWLPSPGNVLFTLLMIGLLLWAQSAGAIPLPRMPASAASSSNTIAYQGRLADAGGAPLTGTYNIIFRLYSAVSGSTPLWEEQWTGTNGVSVSDGLFNVMLGSLTPIPQNIVTDNSTLWLGITVGTDDEMVPRVQLGSVPFAVQALTIPDGSVTTAKIADGAVSSAKAPSLLLGPGIGYRLLSGRVTTNSLGGADIFFTPPFTEPPVVLGIAQGFSVQLYDQPTTHHAAFTINSQTAGVIIHWIAVGH
jgi:hypothetical protein